MSRLARAVSTLASEVTVLVSRSACRLKETSASFRIASALARSASSTEMSSCTSLAPCATSWPLSKPSPVTMPRDLRGDVDALRGDQRADRGQPLDPALRSCAASAVIVAGGGACLDRKLLDHRRLEHELEPGKPAEEGADDDDGYDETLDHRGP